jgi:aryl-alcohol dehydrogenase-like predicted oxidoreductase
MARMIDRIGLGLAALGRPGYINLGHAGDLPSTDVRAMEAQCHAVLDAAWSAGIRYVDAARSYGRAEEFLASWLGTRKIAPGQIFVASKWGYAYTAGWRVDAEKHEVKDHSLAQLERQWEESRALLGPWLRLYQIHSATLESGVLDDKSVHDKLRAIRAEHGVQIGLSVSGERQPEVIRRALSLKLFEAVQATFNVLERSCAPVLAEAKQAGLRVIIKEAMANGRLAPRGDTPVGDAVALRFVADQAFVDTVLSGAATVGHLESNLRFPRATVGELPPAEPSAVYWSKRSRLAWN